MAYHGGTKDVGQTGEGHLVGVAVRGHPLEVEDEEGQRVFIGCWELGYGLQCGCKGIFFTLTLWEGGRGWRQSQRDWARYKTGRGILLL